MGGIDVKMDGSVLWEKLSFKMLGLNFSSKLDRGPYIISIARSASKKIGAWIRSVKFLTPEVALSGDNTKQIWADQFFVRQNQTCQRHIKWQLGSGEHCKPQKRFFLFKTQ